MAGILQWGILGTGNIASQFAAGLAGATRSRLRAVASRTQAQADAFARRFDVSRAHGDYQSLLDDPAVEAVYISAPNALHHPWTLKALKAGKHVLCEKPLALTAAQGREMFDAARAADRLLVEAFMYRTHPLTTAWLREVQSGRIGKVRLIRASFCFQTDNLANIRFDKSLGGGGLMDVGCYCIDLARLVTGEEPLSVQAQGVLSETGVDDLVAATMTFPDGVLASFTCGMRVQADNRASICGQGGYIEIPIPWKPPVTDAAYIVGHSTPPKMDGPGKAAPPPRQAVTVQATGPLYAMEADAFASAVAGEAPPAVSERDSLANLAILDEMRKQIGLRWPSESNEGAGSTQA